MTMLHPWLKGQDRSGDRRAQHRPFAQAPPRYEELIEPESKICPCCSVELIDRHGRQLRRSTSCRRFSG